MEKKNKISRREFLSYSAVAGVAGALGVSPLLTSCEGGSKDKGPTPLKAAGEYYIPTLTDKAIDGKSLKAGLIGCGGRGTGAARNFLQAADNVSIVALGDVFQNQIDSTNKHLKEKFGVEVPADKCFTGFDAYQKVIDSGVDVVLIATPPAFRPIHFKYATDKGVHSFLEKPIAVDAEGYRSIMSTARQAASKNLSVITGTQRHHQRSYTASYKNIMDGMIGEITGGTVYWNQNQLWFKERQSGWSDMEWMIRDWVNWRWLSGDHIVEQHVHNIDVYTWFTGLKPVSATSFGGRHRRVTGDQYDFFDVDFLMEDGTHMHSMCRQIDGCSNNVSEFIQGTRGSWIGSQGGDHIIRDLKGNEIWKYDFEAQNAEFKQNDPYVLEHVNWITHIRNGNPINQAEETATSNLAGIMGRESAYTGQSVTWDEAIAMKQNLMPEKLELGKMDMTINIPVPGRQDD